MFASRLLTQSRRLSLPLTRTYLTSLASQQAAEKEIWRTARFTRERQRVADGEGIERRWQEDKARDAENKVEKSALFRAIGSNYHEETEATTEAAPLTPEKRLPSFLGLAKEVREPQWQPSSDPEHQGDEEGVLPTNPQVRNQVDKYLMAYQNDRKPKYGHPSVRTAMKYLRDVSFASRKCQLLASPQLDLLLSDLKIVLPKVVEVRELAKAAYCLTLIHNFSDVSMKDLFAVLLPCFTPEVMARANDKDIAQILWVLSKVGLENPALYDLCARRVVSNIGSYSLQNLSLVAWSFSKARIPANDLFQAIKAAANLAEGGAEGKEYACLAAAYELRVPDDADFMFTLAAHCQTQLDRFSERGLSDFLGSFAITGLPVNPLFEAGLREVMRPGRRFAPREIVKLIIAFTNAGIPCGPEINHLAAQVLPHLPDLPVTEATLGAWALVSNPFFTSRASLGAALSSLLPWLHDSKPAQVVALYSLLRLRHPVFPEALVGTLADPATSLLPLPTKSHQLLAIWSINVIKRDLRSDFLAAPERRDNNGAGGETLLRSTLGSLRPQLGPEVAERGRTLLLRLSEFLTGFSQEFSTLEGLNGFSPHETALLAASFALGGHNRGAFFNLWVPRALDMTTFSDPHFRDILLLLLSSYILFGATKGPHFSRVVEKISTVAHDYHGRDLVHLAALARLTHTSLKPTDIWARIGASRSTIDPEYHDLLELSQANFVTRMAPECVIRAHKALLEESLSRGVQPSIRGLFE